MNASSIFKGSFLTAAVLFAVSAFAASKGSLELQHQTNVGGKQLASGNYTVQWEGTGDQVALKIYRGKNEVASASAHVIKVKPADNNSAVVTTNSDGSSSLAEIRFRGKDFALQLTSEGGGSGDSGSAR